MRNLNSTSAGWPSGALSASPNLAVGQWLKSGLRRWGVMLATRRQRLDLRELDDRTLKDIGVSRIDVEREASRHFWDIADRIDESTFRRSGSRFVERTCDKTKI